MTLVTLLLALRRVQVARAAWLLLAFVWLGFLPKARAQGCPVIATDLPVFLELADAGVTVIARADTKALCAAIQDHAGSDRRPQAGRQAPFLWRDSACQCLERVQALLQRGVAAPPVRSPTQ